MNAQLRRAAKACLFSTMTGLLLTSDGFVLADVPGRIRHADAEEAAASEPTPLATLGEARPIPTRNDSTRGASEKVTGSKTKAKGKTPAKRPPATRTSPAASASPAANRDKEDGIEQTGALQGRPYGTQRPAPAIAPPSAQTTAPATSEQPASSSPSAIERELEELYRKNGRQMPEMNMQEFQAPQPEAAPTQIPAGRANNQNGSPAGYQPGVRPTKPNFFERVFGFGRSRSKATPRTSAPSSPRNNANNNPTRPNGQSGSSSYGPYVPGSTRTPPPTTPFRPAPTPTAIAAPATPPVVAPAQRPQPMQMREPTPLGPAGAPAPSYQQTPPRSANGLSNREGQGLLDESNLRGDSESLELSQDDESPAARTAPKILPNQSANGSAESPYTGLRITPQESEDSIARNTELDKNFTDELETVTPAGPAASAKESATKAAPSTAESSLRHPLAGSAKTAPAAPANTRAAPRSDDDELMELDDEEEEDEDEEDEAPAKAPQAPAGKTPSTPREEKPVFPRQTAGGEPVAAPAATAAIGSKAAATAKEPEKSAASAAPKGFKGFCPVILKDERRLVEARSQFKSEYRGRTYTFSSFEAKEAFEETPHKYIPAGDGNDVVRLAGGEQGVEGSLEHAAWYRGKLYLFSSAESRNEFVETPSKFNVKE